ncbi:unnamed protein product [Vicia faba]|uniref:Uncharacterized protein n=1 Tax=Vicia faba TaxID=3906 RepID=A0AAV0Z1H8_VICFA|nr:unnamed protein product [Vicia faba]
MKAKYPTEEKLLREFINLTNLSHFTEVYNRLMLIKESKKKAYNEAICSTYNKQLCIFVCCMINELSSGFLTPVITVLDAIGIKPTVYPSETYYQTFDEQKIYVCQTDNKLRIHQFVDNRERGNARGLCKLLDWPTILVYFGCCILILFNKFISEENYKTFMTESIRHLRERARCDPDVKLDIPFDFKEANAIKTMIGSCSTLCSHSIEFLLWHMNCQNSGIGFVCQYLGNELAWMDMHHLVLMNDYLVTSKSPVLRDLRVSREVEDLNRAITKVSSYRYPQFYMFMVSNLERFKIEPFVFPTLIAVAQVLEKGDYNVTNLESSSTKAANLSMVQSLVTLHQTAFPQNHSSPSSVQMQAVKEENRQKRSRTPMEQKNQILRASNVQMPPIIQEKTHLIILD